LEDILQQSHLSQTSQFLILKNSGHMGMLEEPELLNKILIDFLS
jgi:pimeloyl-ACP methyl ester carboxylesterase